MAPSPPGITRGALDTNQACECCENKISVIIYSIFYVVRITINLSLFVKFQLGVCLQLPQVSLISSGALLASQALNYPKLTRGLL